MSHELTALYERLSYNDELQGIGRASRSEGRKKFNVNLIVNTKVFLYN